MRRSRKSPPLPVRDGVSPQSVFLPQGHWPTVLAFLCDRFPAVGSEVWMRRLAAGDVVDGQGKPLQPEQPFLPGTRIYYYRAVTDEVRIPCDEIVLYQDDHLLVADKPHFLPTQPAGPFVQETLVARLRRRLGIDELEPLHRLDRDTAGLVLLSVNPASRDAYHALFRERRVQKIYQAIAPAAAGLAFPLDYSSRIVRDSAGYRHREEPGPPNSATRIDLAESQGDWARYHLQPHTGRTHQLRVHMAALGLPIRHDPLYPVDEHRPPQDFSRPLQLLASELRLDDPFTGECRCFQTGFSLILPPG